jgi:2-polyprenyl-3-methyl-5-hydroxy-6-metoxy-1,4-benzoquinol methylase
MSLSCSICNQKCSSKKIIVRSGKEMDLYRCENCDFNFFNLDPSVSLSKNKLDESRLKSVGLNIPSVNKDFENGTKQSKPYLNEFIDTNDKGTNILEIGCSVGYFLNLLKKKDINPFGVELNKIRANYIRKHLEIPCFDTLEKCEETGIKFKKIFLFYVLEYISNPIKYFERLIKMLEPGGSIILITPNLNDALKDLWKNEGFNRFFYDEFAINYFSVKAAENFTKCLPISKYNIYTKQGYSFLNHSSWHFTDKPRTTGIVGGDLFVKDLTNSFNNSRIIFNKEIINLFNDFDIKYKEILENNDFGNQIVMILDK